MNQSKAIFISLITIAFAVYSKAQFVKSVQQLSKTPFLEFNEKSTFALPTNIGYWSFTDSSFAFYYSQKNNVPHKSYEVKFLNTSQQKSFEVPRWLTEKYIYLFPNKHLRGTYSFTVKNIYPNIDLLYSLGDEGKFKYSFILHEFAKVNQIQMKYFFEGQNTYPVLNNNSIEVKSALLTYSESRLFGLDKNKTQIDVNYTQYSESIGFYIPQKSLKKLQYPIIIDPWVSIVDTLKISNKYSNKNYENMAVDVEYDNAGNTYIYGGAVNFQDIPRIAKYDPKGNVKWVFLGSVVIPPGMLFSIGIYSGGINSFAYNRYENRIYVGPCLSRTNLNGELIALDSNGMWDTTHVIVGSIRFLNSYFTKCSDRKTRWVEGPSFTSAYKLLHVGYGTMADTCISCKKLFHPDTIIFDVFKIVLDDDDKVYLNYSGGIDKRKYYPIYSSTLNSSYVNMISAITDSMTTTKWTQRNPEWIYGNAGRSCHKPKPYGYGLGSPIHSLGVNNRFLCYYDGRHYQVFDKFTGKLLINDSFKQNLLTVQAGVYIDPCDNVYLGFDSSRIKVFHIEKSSLKLIKTHKIWSRSDCNVLDIRFNKTTGKIHFCGDSMVGVIDPFVNCIPSEFTLRIDTATKCQNKSIVRIKKPLQNKKYRIVWEDISSKSIVREAVYNPGNSDTIDIIDTLVNRKITSYYKVYGIMYQACENINLIPAYVSPYWLSDTALKRKGCTGDSFLIHKKRYFKSGFFTDTLKNSCGCDSVLKIKIAIHTDTTVYQKYWLCKGDTLVFGNKKYTKNATHIDSFFNIEGCDSVVHRNIFVKPVFSTSWSEVLCKNTKYKYRNKFYTAPNVILDTLIAANGCDSMVNIQLFESQLKADFDVDSSNVPQFNYRQTSQNNISFLWKLGDGITNAIDKNTSHTYKNEKDTQIQICLIAKDSLGCSDTLCKTINIYSLKYFLYNVFTPNSDGKNDNLFIGYNHIPFKYNIQIYNRWGALVFNNNKININDTASFWNGKIQNTGPDCPAGTYFVIYQFYLKGDNNAPTQINGSVQLIRE